MIGTFDVAVIAFGIAALVAVIAAALVVGMVGR